MKSIPVTVLFTTLSTGVVPGQFALVQGRVMDFYTYITCIYEVSVPGVKLCLLLNKVPSKIGQIAGEF
ncbi:MAG TPA: hypothetical protein VK666_19105 [Chryseolinea sp.]|nr:hypothetical protein [Chryseolinea sp.]